ARVLDALKRSGESFSQFAQRQTQAHAEYFRSQPLDAAEQAAFETAAQRSHDEQAALEAPPESAFDQSVAAYQASPPSIGIGSPAGIGFRPVRRGLSGKPAVHRHLR